jgi:hypothetical protein
MGYYSRLLEVMMYFSGYIPLSLTCLEVSSILSFRLADNLGSVHWCQLRQLSLPCCGTYPNSETKLVARESTDLHFKKPGITVVANTRWLGSVAGRWLGGPMAAMGPAVDKADKARSAQ